MEPIYYDEAIELLDISMDTLRHGVTRRVLTPLPRQGQRQRLMKEQVLLFKGKRLSLAALSPDERQVWAKYAALAVDPSAFPVRSVQEIARQESTKRVDELKSDITDDVTSEAVRRIIEHMSSLLPKQPAVA